jgi:hypothetical protein
MQPDDFKSVIKEIGALIDARAKTTETVLKAHVSAEIKASEARTTKRIDEAKEELRAELATKEQVANVAIAIHQVDTTLVKKVNKHERRLENLEESLQSHC